MDNHRAEAAAAAAAVSDSEPAEEIHALNDVTPAASPPQLPLDAERAARLIQVRC